MIRGVHIDIHRRLIIGEGVHDQVFLCDLCTAHAAIDGYCVTFVKDLAPDKPGYEGFPLALATLTQQPHFYDLLDLVVLCDAGEKPQATAKDALNKISGTIGRIDQFKYAAPAEPNVVNKTTPKSGPRVHLILLPWSDQPGGVETLLLEALEEQVAPHKKCITDFSACSGAEKWTKEKRDKLHLQAALGLMKKGKPDLELNQLRQMVSGALPSDHAAFKKLIGLLTEIHALADGK